MKYGIFPIKGTGSREKNVISSCEYLRLQYFQINDDILDHGKYRQHLPFLLFEDKGRLQAQGNGIKIWLLPGQSLSREQERD